MDFTGSAPEALPDQPEQGDTALRRSTSMQSSQSDSTSLYSSASSVGSVSSFGSSASSRRIIVPLYNLSAHNVMTNAVLDAGTDAKIAKFMKRGVELIDLCVLEPTEIWPSRTPAAASGVDNASLRLPPPAHGDRISSPAPSTTSVDRQSLDATSQPAAAAAADAKPRSRFSNLFSRKDANNRSASLGAPAAPADSPAAKKRASTSPAPPVEYLSAPVLGLQSSIYSAVHPPVGKSPASISWVVRKWIKGSDSSLLGNLRASTRKGQDAAAAAVPTVRFEWVRAPARSNTGDAHSRFTTDATAADSRRSSRIVNAAAPAADDARPSQPGSPKSLDFAQLPKPEHPAADAVSHDEAASATTGTDAGDESDPEDSETPWTCTLVISLPGNVSPSPSDSSNNPSKRLSLVSTESAHPNPLRPGAGGSFRLRLATLSPTPHHPKVVAQLKIPWPLPDIDVVQGVAHKRSPTGRPSSSAGTGLLVTAEEMKDIVCTTAFWMIVREGFGGVGRKTRKGDGWRIRG
ncbi:hypothetical protein AURDEDRAFT_114639 [Auricularia subglabra TFB-10046 SS5]|nr:hypothetical protein AURDEDRAFT_114639 [Auricularia subglabra TFB-10046 SS5]